MNDVDALLNRLCHLMVAFERSIREAPDNSGDMSDLIDATALTTDCSVSAIESNPYLLRKVEDVVAGALGNAAVGQPVQVRVASGQTVSGKAQAGGWVELEP